MRVTDGFFDSFDGLQSNVVFCTWTGANQMSDRRREALLSILGTTNCAVVYLNADSIPHWQHPGCAFHPAFELLSAVHKADYLRCYLMHHYGGGYTDIKPTSKDWSAAFARLRASEALALGYTEVGPHGITPTYTPLDRVLAKNYQRVIGLGAFVFRRRTALTEEWYAKTCRLLDARLPALVENPARHPRDCSGRALDDGTRSMYPLAWGELLSTILHPLAFKYSRAILHADIAPEFTNYD